MPELASHQSIKSSSQNGAFIIQGDRGPKEIRNPPGTARVQDGNWAHAHMCEPKSIIFRRALLASRATCSQQPADSCKKVLKRFSGNRNRITFTRIA